MKPGNILTREFLEEQYVALRKPTRVIAEEFGIKSNTSIKYYLHKYGILPENPTPRKGRPNVKSRTGFNGELSGSYMHIVKNSAKRRGFTFDVNSNFLWELFIKQKRRCALSGVELRFAPVTSFEGRLQQTASLDRIDSSRGYIESNVQWIHKDLNTMKMDHSQTNFIEWCGLVYRYQRGVI